jgi:alkylhydroperoxidase family enzyme
MNTTPPRIAPGGLRQVGPFVWLFAHVAGRVAGTEPPKLFLTLGRHRPLFWGWLHFAGRLMPGGKLARRESELVILRVAHLRGNQYEFTHHVRLGRRAGITDADLERIVASPSADGWSARERSMLTCVDHLHHTRDIDDAAWDELRAHLPEREAIELCLLVGHYEMLATTLDALRLQQPDDVRRAATN